MDMLTKNSREGYFKGGRKEKNNTEGIMEDHTSLTKKKKRKEKEVTKIFGKKTLVTKKTYDSLESLKNISFHLRINLLLFGKSNRCIS